MDEFVRIYREECEIIRLIDLPDFMPIHFNQYYSNDVIYCIITNSMPRLNDAQKIEQLTSFRKLEEDCYSLMPDKMIIKDDDDRKHLIVQFDYPCKVYLNGKLFTTWSLDHANTLEKRNNQLFVKRFGYPTYVETPKSIKIIDSETIRCFYDDRVIDSEIYENMPELTDSFHGDLLIEMDDDHTSFNSNQYIVGYSIQ